MINVLDITGQKFNHLTAISPTEKRSGKSIVWKCFCDCGNKIEYYDRYCAKCKPSEELFEMPTVSKPEPKFIKCPNCGAEIKENALRCRFCKTMLKK